MSQGHQVPSINRVAPVARFRYLAALRLLPLFQLLSFQSFSFRLSMSRGPRRLHWCARSPLASATSRLPVYGALSLQAPFSFQLSVFRFPNNFLL